MAAKYSIAFYNLENLFDTEDDPFTLDDDFTEDSKQRWNEKRFNKKLKKLGSVISAIGYNRIEFPPVIVGIAEVENEYVVKRLTNSKFLKKKGYDYVHFDSPDERGIDTALLYRSKYFEVLEKAVHGVGLFDENGEPDYTRDVLHIKGRLEKQVFHVLVNHWPSRRAGVEETAHKRIEVAKKNREIIENNFREDPDARIVIMGDFNDNPNDKSVRILVHRDFYNPMEQLLTNDSGSLSHKGDWNLFDQIMVSHNFLKQYQNDFRFESAHVFSPRDIQTYKGRFKGSPFRTFAGKKYLGGTSDHFPVYSIFSIDSD